MESYDYEIAGFSVSKFIQGFLDGLAFFITVNAFTLAKVYRIGEKVDI
jgi:hypothetical protein